LKATEQALQALFENTALAVAFVERADNTQWQLSWQNSTAHSLWGEYDVNADLELKLHLLGVVQRNMPLTFSHHLPGSVEAFQFTLTHYDNGVLVQFVMVTPDSKPQLVEQQDQTLYRGVVEGAALGVFDWDLSRDTVRYNDRLYQMCDLSPADLGHTKKGLFERIHPEDLSRFEDALFAHLEAHWPFNVAIRFQSSHNNYIWMQVTGSASWDHTGSKALRLVGSLRDITDAKRVEQTVRQREALIEQILDALPVSIFVKDAQGCFRFFSKQTERLTGVARNKAIGRTDFEVFSIETARENIELDHQAKQLGHLVLGESQMQVEGQQRWLMTGTGPIHIQRTDHQTETWILGFALDITERREMELVLRQARQEAEAAAKAKSEFLSVMSHEIRTPLNSVIGTSALLLDTALSSEQHQQIEMIKRSGEHLLHLINDILDFNKLDAGQVELERHAFDLQEQLEIVQSIILPSAEVKGVELAFDSVSDDMGFAWGDAARLRQVLLNLVGNAVKFTEHGHVHLKIRPDSNSSKVRFEVEDTGIGIAADKLDKLFSEFTQVDASTTRKYGGTGLGLSISKRLVEAMGGKIGVTSQLGKGSVFWFELPLERASAQDIEKAHLTEDFEQQHALSILVAEDNPPNQLLIRAILTKLGHSVTIAANGAKVLQALQDPNQNFDLILMDMQMPEMDGLEATRKIRALEDEKLALTPIVALTANALVGDRERVLEAGMNDYLSKPIDINALKRALWQWSR
jgi:PAS domain S-box-containing protein